MKIILPSFGVLCLFMVSLYAVGPSEPDTFQTYHLKDSVVVIANRYQLSWKAVANTSEILPVKEYDGVAVHSVLQLTDMISPQVYVMEKKILGYGVGPNGAGNVSMRGLGGRPNTGILVLINGRPDFMAIFGHPLPDVYGMNDIEHVEVIRGPSSTLFGSNAMGGVINLVTTKPAAHKIKVGLQLGSYQTSTQNILLGAEITKTKMELNVSHQNTGGHIDSSNFEGWNLGAKVHMPVSKNWLVSLEGKYTPFTFNDPFMGADLAGLGVYGKIRRGMVDLRLEGKTTKLQNSFHLYSNLGHHRFNDGFESHDFSYGFSSYQYLTVSKKTQLSFGADVLHYGGKAYNVVPPGLFPRPDLHLVNSLGTYLVGFYSPVSVVNLQAGIRYQYSSLNIQRVSPTLGLSVVPLAALRLFANYNDAFRIPTLQELYLFPTSNSELNPETTRSYETGVYVYFQEHDFVKISLFQNYVQNIINLVGIPPNLSYQNSGKAKQSGVELQINYLFRNRLDIQLSHSYINPDYLIAYNPRNLFKFWLSWNYRKLAISTFGKYVSDLYASNDEASRLNDYFLLNASVVYRYRTLAFTLQFRNVLDRQYEVLMNYPAPGFHFLAGIELVMH
ncbi:MAG: TonB-dependent receptor [bacterium]|nr:MAG: TonB-dependent receptor [bacterium]